MEWLQRTVKDFHFMKCSELGGRGSRRAAQSPRLLNAPDLAASSASNLPAFNTLRRCPTETDHTQFIQFPLIHHLI